MKTLVALPLLALTAFAQQDDTQALARRPIEGVRAHSGFLVVRPLQPTSAQRRGIGASELRLRRAAAAARLAQHELYKFVPETEESIIDVPEGLDDAQFAAQLMASGDFEYAQPDWIVFPAGCPNDTYFNSQWHHQVLGSCNAWNYATGRTEITVAVCDTGVRPTHVDLSSARREGFNGVQRKWESGGGLVTDVHGHGTQTAGVAAARGNNGAGVSGMGWGLSYRPVRISDSPAGTAALSDILAAARAAADAGDKVISVSFSGVADPAVETTGAYVRSRGALLVWAAGNYAEVHGGVRTDSVIIVGATDATGNLATFSGRGQRLDFVAPGTDIFTTSNAGDNAYASSTGTSFSTPMVAGLCGLIWSYNPALTPAQVESILRASATDLGAPGVDDTYGYGRINPAAALALATPGSRTVLWATSAPDNVAWTNESYATGSETCDDCNSSTCLYSTNATSGNVTPLLADDFQSFTLPAGRKIVKVEVEVACRYDTNTTASIGIRAFAPSFGLDSGWRTSPSFQSGTRCAPRAGATGDITSLSASWTAAMVNNLQLQVRRQSGLAGNNLRVVSMKVLVTTAPL